MVLAILKDGPCFLISKGPKLQQKKLQDVFYFCCAPKAGTFATRKITTAENRNMKRIIIFDTTLRDGEQSPGASLDTQKKLEIAHQLARLGVDVIEAGFPISSPGDFDAVKKIASQVKGPAICGLARATKLDIDAVYRAIAPAKKKRIHVFLATSKIHMRYKLKKAKEEILHQAVESVRYAKRLVSDIEFSPEDASRTEKEFLFKVVEAAIAAGATTINIPDTVGYAIPEEFGRLIKEIKENVFNINIPSGN